MATEVGKGHVFGVPATLSLFAADSTTIIVSGWITPNLQGSGLTHSFEADEIANQAGNIESLIGGMKEKLECEFDFIPRGASIAIAKLSSSLPPPLGKCLITGAPIIVVGSWTDAFNTNGTNTQPWLYVGGSLAESAGGKMTGKIKLVRFIGITSAVPVT